MNHPFGPIQPKLLVVYLLILHYCIAQSGVYCTRRYRALRALSSSSCGGLLRQPSAAILGPSVQICTVGANLVCTLLYVLCCNILYCTHLVSLLYCSCET
jgi:hypothetical protein